MLLRYRLSVSGTVREKKINGIAKCCVEHQYGLILVARDCEYNQVIGQVSTGWDYTHVSTVVCFQNSRLRPYGDWVRSLWIQSISTARRQGFPAFMLGAGQKARTWTMASFSPWCPGL